MARKGKAAAPARKGAHRRVIRARVNTHAVVAAALDFAVARGITRHDKYAEEPLRANEGLLADKIAESFWLALVDAGVELY